VIGQVVGVHLDEALIADGRVDTAAIRPIARCGYQGEYAVVERLFEMRRPG
jgi:flavin reductase (DIM6/NTAB) family NADH-FMN oxidoreductase RutF